MLTKTQTFKDSKKHGRNFEPVRVRKSSHQKLSESKMLMSKMFVSKMFVSKMFVSKMFVLKMNFRKYSSKWKSSPDEVQHQLI